MTAPWSRTSAARLTLLLGLGLSAGGAAAQEGEERPSVIYFIGDGMGVSQISLGRLAARRLGQGYAFDRFPVTGLASTRSADNVVTDSAAGATALAAGVKTTNWSVGVDPEGRPVEGILEVAARSGYKTGVLTTARLTHATPAGFTTHVWHRLDEAEIAAAQVRGFTPDVFVGGGGRYFGPDLRDALQADGYEVVDDATGLRAASAPKLAGFLARSHLPYAIDREESAPSLAELTATTVRTLAAQGPFVLMVEAGRVDHACHVHDAGAMVHEQLDAARALDWILDYAESEGDVLVVVTADHATGGLAISEDTNIVGLLRGGASVGELLHEVPEEDDLARLREVVFETYAEVELSPEELGRLDDHMGGFWRAMALGHMISSRFGVHWYDLEDAHGQKGTHAHDGAAVPVFAAGPGAERFSGLYENSEIPRRICEVTGLPAPGEVLDRSE